MQEWLGPVGVVLLGYTVLGLTGFGSALVIVPLLAWQWPLPEVVALTLLMLVLGLISRSVGDRLTARLVGALGGVGINTAHEMGHKKENLERWLATRAEYLKA